MKNKNTEDFLSNLSFEDVENLIEESSFKPSQLTTKRFSSEKKEFSTHGELKNPSNYTIIRKYGTLSDDLYAPVVAKIDWFGYERIDVRRWKKDGSPGKGVTFSVDELKILKEALEIFDFNKKFINIVRTYKGAKSTALFYYKIVQLSAHDNKGTTWLKEVNIIDWGYGPKVDFHQWTTQYDKCTKGICISISELKKLKEIIANIE